MVTRETALMEGLRSLGIDPTARMLGRLSRYAELLLEEAVPRGFLGKGESGRLLPRHILEAAGVALLVGDGAVADVGSGAGIPGVVVACVRPGPMLLVDGEGRKARFLEHCARELGLEAVTVLRTRAEQLGREGSYRDAIPNVLARALAPPPVALELCLPLCSPGGRVIIVAGPSVVGRSEDLQAVCQVLGGHLEEVQRLEIPGAEASSWAVIVRKVGASPPGYPRRPGVAARKPLRPWRKDDAP